MDIQEIMIKINQLQIININLKEEYKKISNNDDAYKIIGLINNIESRIVELERKKQIEEYKQFKANEEINVDFLAQGIEENRRYGKKQIEIALQKLDGNYIEIDGQNIIENDSYDNILGISQTEFPIMEEYAKIR